MGGHVSSSYRDSHRGGPHMKRKWVSALVAQASQETLRRGIGAQVASRLCFHRGATPVSPTSPSPGMILNIIAVDLDPAVFSFARFKDTSASEASSKRQPVPMRPPSELASSDSRFRGISGGHKRLRRRICRPCFMVALETGTNSSQVHLFSISLQFQCLLPAPLACLLDSIRL